MTKSKLIKFGSILIIINKLIHTNQITKADQGKYTDVLPKESYIIETRTNSISSELPVKLPHGDLLTQFIPQAINIALALTGSLLLIAMVYAGVVYVTSRGNEEKITTAKKILSYAAVGLVIISSSYAITLGISKLAFD